LLAALATAGGAACGGDGSDSGAPAGAPAAPAAEARRLPVDLYFPGAGGRLHAERRDLAAPDDPVAQARAVLAALLAGPEDPALLPVFPEGWGEVAVAALLLDPDGALLVDLHAPGRDAPPAGGSREELVTVYSLVNSLALNVPAARRVVLLWNGSQRRSFAGHVDTSRPLAPDPSLVAR
jgi:hypothetical protein